MPTAQSVSVNVFVGAGSRAEDARTKGLAHFLEHMVFKGTEKRPTAMAIAEAIEGAGGVLTPTPPRSSPATGTRSPSTAWSWPWTCFPTCSRTPCWTRRRSTASAPWCSRRSGGPRTSRAPGAASCWARRCSATSRWAGRSRARRIRCGAAATGLRLLDGTWYGAANIVLSVAGNTTPDTWPSWRGAVRRTAPGRSRLRHPGGGAPARPASRSRTAVRSPRPTWPSAMPALPRDDPDRYLLQILNSLLGRGMSPRLFKEVRERRGLAYSYRLVVSRLGIRASWPFRLACRRRT